MVLFAVDPDEPIAVFPSSIPPSPIAIVFHKAGRILQNENGMAWAHF